LVPWEAWLVARDGAEHIIELTVSELQSETHRIGLGVFVRDVTESRRLAEELSFQASHDPLTDLPNRRAFERQLGALHRASRETGQQHALCFVDLDRFKIINDTCGHAAGDELLKQMGEVLNRRLRSGELVARLGGDADELLRKVDAACYLAKEGGRYRVHIHDDDDISLARRRGEMRWVHELERALEEDRLKVFYQRIEPAVDTGQDRWAEMLVRVRTTDGELHSPGAFLPAAERYGLAPRLDEWIVDRYLTWMETGASEMLGVTRCSVNLSGMTLGSDVFHKFVTARLDASNIDPARICFEITETAAISNLVAARRLIESLRNRGCQFALGDFGSGLSSFGYLRELPVDHLKIDGSFVRSIDSDGLDRELVRSINAIGHIMGLTTVAEYVESPSILAELRRTGVDYVQGYAIHRPEAAIVSSHSN
jgi:ammonium transporter, Amt family